MGELVPLTGEIKAHLATLLATAVSAAPTLTAVSAAPDPTVLRAAVIDFVLDVDQRHRRGWSKVNMRKVAVLRALVGLPEPPHHEETKR